MKASSSNPDPAPGGPTASANKVPVILQILPSLVTGGVERGAGREARGAGGGGGE